MLVHSLTTNAYFKNAGEMVVAETRVAHFKVLRGCWIPDLAIWFCRLGRCESERHTGDLKVFGWKGRKNGAGGGEGCK